MWGKERSSGRQGFGRGVVGLCFYFDYFFYKYLVENFYRTTVRTGSREEVHVVNLLFSFSDRLLGLEDGCPVLHTEE